MKFSVKTAPSTVNRGPPFATSNRFSHEHFVLQKKGFLSRRKGYSWQSTDIRLSQDRAADKPSCTVGGPMLTTGAALGKGSSRLTSISDEIKSFFGLFFA